jgi:hypothetical protein
MSKNLTLTGLNGKQEKHFYMNFLDFKQLLFDDKPVKMEDAKTQSLITNQYGIQRVLSYERIIEIHQNICQQKVIQGI